MPTIVPVKRATGRAYKVIVRPKGMTPYSKTFKTKKAAQCWAKLQQVDVDLLAAGVDPEALRMSLADLCDRYLQHSWRGKDMNRPRHVDWWREQLGNRPVQGITQFEVAAKLEMYAAGKAQVYVGVDADGKPKHREVNKPRRPATVNRLRAALAAVFKYGREKYGLDNDPCKAVRKEPENNARERVLDSTERTALLKACKASQWDRLYLLAIMAMTSGARLGEMLGLRYRDLDLPNSRGTLRNTKNGSVRHIHLVDEVVTEIRKFASPLDRSTLLFQSEIKPGKPFEFRKIWNDAVEKSGIKIGEGKHKFVFHCLRHGTASFLAGQGLSLTEIGAVLGHKNVASTKRYSHLCDEQTNNTVRVMGAKMLQGTGDG